MVVKCGRFRWISGLLPLISVIAAPESPAQSVPVQVNQNHTPAGVLQDGVLTIAMVLLPVVIEPPSLAGQIRCFLDEHRQSGVFDRVIT
jgi:hypothetical protein